MLMNQMTLLKKNSKNSISNNKYYCINIYMIWIENESIIYNMIFYSLYLIKN